MITVFGVSLEEVLALEKEKGRDIPSFVEEGLQVIEEKGLGVEGIFRLSGISSLPLGVDR